MIRIQNTFTGAQAEVELDAILGPWAAEDPRDVVLVDIARWVLAFGEMHDQIFGSEPSDPADRLADALAQEQAGYLADRAAEAALGDNEAYVWELTADLTEIHDWFVANAPRILEIARMENTLELS